ncbi:hypothetical protein Oant_4540 (plasmid) [Brucella anthropi ATCC 49188]|uniref:Uncharacterized protein n=1 Tax=Brucella anthropi (strain ATCC 49188 / DSM 6882 / CCUG 24695 / JCM 21032 / LMG 3331 / NBRC 15819 / NCTC 12168 / Alc 37) TaxID=439375 RepID=A6X7M3_BRUA4|nr:hypothetical protein Oant_4540 [Brucella anthropi ATCC 49188]
MRKGGEWLFDRKNVVMQPGCAPIRLKEAILRYLPRNHGIDIAEYGYAENDARERLLGIWAADVESLHLYRRVHTSR